LRAAFESRRTASGNYPHVDLQIGMLEAEPVVVCGRVFVNERVPDKCRHLPSTALIERGFRLRHDLLRHLLGEVVARVLAYAHLHSSIETAYRPSGVDVATDPATNPADPRIWSEHLDAS
jgi:hypothetical protein